MHPTILGSSIALDGLKDRLLAPDLVAGFMKAMQDELAAEIDRKISGMMRTIDDGLYEPSMKDRLKAHQNERRALDLDVGGT